MTKSTLNKTGLEPVSVYYIYAELSRLGHRLRYMFFFFYKHMKFRNQARLCKAICDFETHIMLSLCLTFQGTELPEQYGENLTPMWLRKVNLFSEFC